MNFQPSRNKSNFSINTMANIRRVNRLKPIAQASGHHEQALDRCKQKILDNNIIIHTFRGDFVPCFRLNKNFQTQSSNF